MCFKYLPLLSRKHAFAAACRQVIDDSDLSKAYAIGTCRSTFALRSAERSGERPCRVSCHVAVAPYVQIYVAVDEVAVSLTGSVRQVFYGGEDGKYAYAAHGREKCFDSIDEQFADTSSRIGRFGGFVPDDRR